MHSGLVPALSAALEYGCGNELSFLKSRGCQFGHFECANFNSVNGTAVLCETDDTVIQHQNASSRPRGVWIAVNYRTVGMFGPRSAETFRMKKTECAGPVWCAGKVVQQLPAIPKTEHTIVFELVANQQI